MNVNIFTQKYSITGGGIMFSNKLLWKILSSALSCTMILGTGFTTAGRVIGTDTHIHAAETLAYGDFDYELNDENTVTVTKYKGHDKNVVIPDTINGRQVTVIGSYAFGNCRDITDITIPDSVTSIGERAFVSCENLTGVTLGRNVETIGRYSFDYCKNLTNITADENNAFYSSDNGVLFDKNKAKIIFFPNGKKGKYSVPDSVTGIGEWAFYRCENLTDITISDNVTSIGENAFDSCRRLTSVNMGCNVENIGDYAFLNCTGLTEIILSDNVTAIGDYAFLNCTSLKSAVIPYSVANIGEYSFSYENVKEYDIQYDNLKVIIYGSKDSYAETYAQKTGRQFIEREKPLENNSELTEEIMFGESATVNAKARGGKGGYTYAVYYKEKSAEKWTVVQSYKANRIITIKPKKAGEYDICVKVQDRTGEIVKKYFTLIVTADFWEYGPYRYQLNEDDTVRIIKCADNAETIVIPDRIDGKQVIVIDSCAFAGCTELTSISVDENNIAYSADYGVLFDKSGTEMKNYPTGKEGSHLVGDEVTAIGENAFRNCIGLTSITIPESVTLIGENAFYGCTGLTSITIPESVTAIGENVFFGCTNLKMIYGLKDSYAETYAKDNNIPFLELSSLLRNNSELAGEITLGELLTVNAKASGGTGNYTYAVYYKQQSQSKWTVCQTYDSNDKIIIKPKKAVLYDVCVKAKDSVGYVVRAYFTVDVRYDLINISSVSSDTVKKGKSVTVMCSAVGNLGTCKYQVLYKQKSQSKWTVVQDFDINETVAVKPTKITDYDICIKAQDINGQQAKKYFTVTVTK